MGDYLSNVATSGINTAYQSVFDSLATMGRAGIHALAPDNFEYYGCSLELLDSNGNIVGLIDFAVMPNNIVETKTTMMQITKTAAAVVSDETVEPKKVPCCQSNASQTRGIVEARLPPKRIAEIGTPCASSQEGSITGHCDAETVKREFG